MLIESTFEKWRRFTGDIDSDGPTKKSIQREWDEPGMQKVLRELQDAVEPTHAAIITGLTGRWAGAWLNAVPVSRLGLKLSNQETRIACATRLGSRVSHEYTCKCGKTADSKGIHSLSMSCGTWAHISAYGTEQSSPKSLKLCPSSICHRASRTVPR